MNVDKINTTSVTYANYGKQTNEKVKHVKETEDKSVVYEKSNDSVKPVTYSINRMSTEDRKALVEQMRAESEARQNQFISMIEKMLNGQTKAYGQAHDVYRFLAGGNYTVDPVTKNQAIQDISENGYYGVEQTSSRIFDYACALAGNDVEKMKEMQEAFEKGFKGAEKVWGGKLPDICYQTQAAVRKKFEDYYASMKSNTIE